MGAGPGRIRSSFAAFRRALGLEGAMADTGTTETEDAGAQRQLGRGRGGKPMLRKKRPDDRVEERREIFFEALGRTANISASAEEAGIALATVWMWRRKDGDFQRRWAEALDRGYADLEMRMLAMARFGVTAERTVEVDGEGGSHERVRRDDAKIGALLLQRHYPAVAAYRAMARPDAPPPLDPAELAMRVRAAMIEVHKATLAKALPAPARLPAKDAADGGGE